MTDTQVVMFFFVAPITIGLLIAAAYDIRAWLIRTRWMKRDAYRLMPDGSEISTETRNLHAKDDE